MEICHVNLSKGFGGGEQQTLNLIKHLSEQGVEQIVVIHRKSPLFPSLKKLPILIYFASNIFSEHFSLRKKIRGTILHAHDV